MTATRFDLTTTAGRARAERDLMWADHGFLRLRFQNFHWIDEAMARANQPAPAQIAAYAALGFKTIINLRGEADTGYFALEREACAAHGLALVNAPLGSREPPAKDRVRRAKAVFETIAYPALMHCKSGADRAGLMAVLYLHFHKGVPIAAARAQLALKYLHVRHGKTGMLDCFVQTYLDDNAAAPMDFMRWIDEVYDPAIVRRNFRPSWWGNVLVDLLLRRE
jgi:uncharacterized protein (TIGR01244 family)